MDSYGEKFLSVPYEKTDRSYLDKTLMDNKLYNKVRPYDNNECFNGSYDQYASKSKLNDRLNGLLSQIDQVDNNVDAKDRWV